MAATTPTSDFTDNSDGTVTHKTTGLTWKRCVEGMTWTGATCTGTAKSYTWAQATALTSSFSGKSDWRLPTIAELLTIVERDAYNPSINTTIFPNTPASIFWSASDFAAGGNAWKILFFYGVVSIDDKSNSFTVRLVRNGQLSGSLGLYTPSSDFVDNGNGTVTHKKTNLTWKRCAEGQAWSGSSCTGKATYYPWVQAIALNQTYDGFSNWRLPTQNELQTLVEYSIASPGPTINSVVFPNTPTSPFWSASTMAGNPVMWWYVDFYSGSGNMTASSSLVRLVRSGQATTIPTGPLALPQLTVTPTTAAPGEPLTVTFPAIANASEYNLCIGNKTGAYDLGCFQVKSGDKFPMQVGLDFYVALKAKNSKSESAFSKEVHIYAIDPDNDEDQINAYPVVTGTDSDAVIRIYLHPDKNHVGKQNQIFIAAYLPETGWFSRTLKGWEAVTYETLLPAGSGILKAGVLVLGKNLPLQQLDGAAIYVGYGTNRDEMLASDNFIPAYFVTSMDYPTTAFSE